MSTAPRLDRTLFEIHRASEYLSVKELQAQTGQPVGRFGDVALKELLDNGLDEAEKRQDRTPDLTVDVEWRADGGALLRVHDTGDGLPADAVARILHFDTRTSDKSAYRAPTRGMQGNALKTVLGMPAALCGAAAAPVVITARGMRHTIALSTDPAGRVHVQHDKENVEPTVGTTVELVLPAAAWTASAPQWICYVTALFNPHARVHFRPGLQGVPDCRLDVSGRYMSDLLYTPRVTWPKPWKKWLPTDPTSPWWYSGQDFQRLVYAHIAAGQSGGDDKPLGAFVREFRGTRRTALAKQVREAVPGVRHLSEFEGRPDTIGRLYWALRQAAGKPPEADIFGLVGKEPLRALLAGDETGDLFWYEKRTWLTADDIPWAAEVAIAVCPDQDEAAWQFGLNYSAALDDPLADTQLVPESGDYFASEGLVDMLDTLHVIGNDAPYVTATAVHLIAPAMDHRDRGKSRLHVDASGAQTIATMLAKAARVIYKEGEKKRARSYGGRPRESRPPRTASVSLKDAFEQVIEEAYLHALGAQPRVSARMVAYAVRDRIQKLPQAPDKKLDLQYCGQTLIPNYQQDHPGALPGVIYEPRGVLVEPHARGRKRVPLGTLDVEQYVIPPHTYNKILLIEKEGLLPIVENARLAEKYDMAVAATKGYATTAARTLLQRADQHEQYQIFLVHDADPYGYNIAKALREETRRMPGYRVDVVDLGLFYEQAVDALALSTEEFERKKALPADLELSPAAREAFTGRYDAKKRCWIGTRVELNAFTADGLLQFIEDSLRAAGAVGKVRPDDEDVLNEEYDDQLYAAVREQVMAEMEERIEKEFEQARYSEKRPDAEQLRAAVTQGLRDDPYSHWRAVIGDLAAGQVRGEEPR